MRKKTSVAVCVSVVALLWAAPVLAFGVGGMFSAGSGESKWYRENEVADTVSDYADTGTVGGGVVIDTGKPDGMYFTRLNIGIDDYSMRTGYKQRLTRFSVRSTFRFVLVKKEIFRFWLGPQVGVSYLFGRTGYRAYENDIIPYMNPGIWPLVESYLHNTARYNLAGADAGLVVGFDFDIRQYATVTISGGLRYGAQVGGMAYRNGGVFLNNTLVYSHGLERFVDAGVLFRFDDSRKGMNEVES